MMKDVDTRGPIPIKPPMTQQEVENWILLKGQGEERWFEIQILDEEVRDDPTMIALMDTVSEMIYKGMQGMAFTEANKKPDLKPVA